MLIKLVTFTLLICCGCVTISGKVYDYQPQQVHIAFGGNEKISMIACTKEMSNFLILLYSPDNVSEIVITWSTMDDSAESIVEYGINGLILTAQGEAEKFIDGGAAQHSQYIHKVRCLF